MKKQLALLQKRLAKIEKELEGNRTSVIQDGWQTSRYAKKARKWDVLAQEKMAIKGKIEDIEEQMQREVFECPKCLSLDGIDCVCAD